MGTIVLYSVILMFAYMSSWFVYAQVVKRNDVADIAWGLGFIYLTWSLFYLTGIYSAKTSLLLIMVSLWGIRLALHISTRHKGKQEDKRYQAMRSKWSRPVLQSFTNVFMAQGFFLLLVATPLMLFFHENRPLLQWYNFIGLCIWIIGFFFESVSDFQLAQFIKNTDNKGKIMQSGLWKYSRHPNYFGEISQWWGIFLFLIPFPYWIIGAIGPITITVLILGVSGIPLLEKHYKGNKAYEKYQKQTSAFFPAPPKR